MSSARSLKIVSLVTLTVQNSLLTILLHYSRINAGPDEMYSAASAVLLNEILKLGVSFLVSGYGALYSSPQVSLPLDDDLDEKRRGSALDKWAQPLSQGRWQRALGRMRRDVFSADCWKLGIPASLYVFQNNLQYVAASNLDVPTFQVTYNLKILTTALFSVVMLKRRLTVKKWVALTLLAAGVGIVQLQSTAASGTAAKNGQEMDKIKGLLAVASACMTSGLAGVYFEMVLKGSKADLWIRNIQLSLFSLIPAVLPVILPRISYALSPSLQLEGPPPQAVFAHFGVWAWAVVICQVVGGLVTALVIKYADNLLKGFAGSLAVILSFMAGMFLFNFQATASFVTGALIVVAATVLYSQPDVRSLAYPGSTTPADYSPIFKGYSKSPERRPSELPVRRPSEVTPSGRDSISGSIPAGIGGGTYHRSPNSGSQTPEMGGIFDRVEEHTVDIPPASETIEQAPTSNGLDSRRTFIQESTPAL